MSGKSEKSGKGRKQVGQNSPSREGNNSPDDEQDGSDLVSRLNGLMGALGKRTSERDAAIARAEAAEAEVAALRAGQDEQPERSYTPPNPRKVREPLPVDDDPLGALKGASWGDIGVTIRR